MTERIKMPTKEAIMKAAAKLFSGKGYNKVTTREIAKACGINSASIYHYFPSKSHLLTNLYAFYHEEYIKVRPDVEELLRLTETLPPHEVLYRTLFYYEGDVRETMDQILITAAREICSNSENEDFIRTHLINTYEAVLKPVLIKMVELRKIKPMDIDSYLRVLTYYGYSAAALNGSPFCQNVEEYLAGMRCLFQLVVPESPSESQ
ncbi:MAG: TetR/AcrR family transcriptional regulator [Peptococcaceae bacterium]|jgi:AcrR family transcriptional regulator|nr:TetR/AcrR family transcriptional regulator [Peptococcaceae bacterium]